MKFGKGIVRKSYPHIEQKFHSGRPSNDEVSLLAGSEINRPEAHIEAPNSIIPVLSK